MASKKLQKIGKYSDYVQMSWRMHHHDYVLLKTILFNDNLTLSTFAKAMTKAYMDGNPYILKIVNNWKLENTVPEEVRETFTLSMREREKILLDLEAEEKKLEKEREQ